MSNKLIILSHPTGNANVRAVAKGLVQKGMLHTFYTSIAVFPNSIIYRWSKIPLLSELKRRAFDVTLKQHTKSWPWNELFRLLATKIGWVSLIQHERGLYSIDQVYQKFDRYIASIIRKSNVTASIDAVYAYEDGALETFKAAHKKGILCVYDLPIGYYQAARVLMQTEFESNARWAPTLTGFNDSAEKLQRKDHEIQLADQIVVASSFTKYTLEQFYTYSVLPPIQVIPYGFPEVGEAKTYDYHGNNRKLRLLFVGGLSQRKGIANVVEAVQELGEHVTLTIIGNKSVQNCEALNQALLQHHWIPSLPPNQILEQMRAHDVLVFPSLFEGFGLVITEAMSQGTPVITTHRTIGGDFIQNNQNGWLVPPADTAALVQQIEQLIQQPSLIATNGASAQQTAKQRPWAVYEEETCAFLQNIQHS